MQRMLPVAAALAGLIGVGADGGHLRKLTFQDRVEAQRAIELVYYSHQAGAKLPFEQAVSGEVLVEEVRTHLKETAALERYWSTRVRSVALQQEVERITR